LWRNGGNYTANNRATAHRALRATCVKKGKARLAPTARRRLDVGRGKWALPATPYVKISSPEFVVLYNGEKEMDDFIEMKIAQDL
jgi:hypothetical protein